MDKRVYDAVGRSCFKDICNRMCKEKKYNGAASYSLCEDEENAVFGTRALIKVCAYDKCDEVNCKISNCHMDFDFVIDFIVPERCLIEKNIYEKIVESVNAHK